MAVQFKNNASSRLAVAIAVGATSLSVTAGEGAKFPAPAVGDWFPLTLIKASGALEIVQCTARSGDVLTITRAQEGTSAQTFSAGDRVELRLTEGAIAAIREEIAAAKTVADAAVRRTGDTMSGALIAPSISGRLWGGVGGAAGRGFFNFYSPTNDGSTTYGAGIMISGGQAGVSGKGALNITAGGGLTVDAGFTAAAAISAYSGRAALGDGTLTLTAASAGQNLIAAFVNSDASLRGQLYAEPSGILRYTMATVEKFRVESSGIVSAGSVYAGNGSAQLTATADLTGSAWGGGALSTYLANNMAPRPGTGIASWSRISGTLPAGGMWAWYSVSYNSNGAALAIDAGISPGGTFVGPSASGAATYAGFAWRIS